MVRNGVDDARAVPSVFLRVSVAELASFKKSRFPLADTQAGVPLYRSMVCVCHILFWFVNRVKLTA